jgi:Mg-chelatase subunit ChlD
VGREGAGGMSQPDANKDLALARWRLVLGRFADSQLGGAMGGAGRAGAGYGRMDRVLEYLYGREYANRGVRDADGDGRTGGAGESVLNVPDWIREVRELFPRDTVEVVEKHALERYGMTELVTDAEVLKKLEPNYELLKSVLTFRGMMKGEVLEVARKIVREVVEDLKRRLAKDIRQTLWGKLSRRHRSNLKVAKNLDVRRTIRDNLKHYDVERKRLVLQRLHFNSRVQNHSPWHIIIAVDCSGSMIDSVIYSAVMAGIFRGLPSMKVSLVAFDTAVVDLSDEVDDPAELLMSVQLGGGTDIGGALGYCQTLVQQPHKTMLVCVTDFFEGAPPNNLLTAIRHLRESGVRVLGLAALDEKAEPVYDKEMAQRCVAAGAEVAALTPQRLAEWIGRILK